MLQALPGYALIELPVKYESGLATEKEKYATRSEGRLLDMMVTVDRTEYNEHKKAYTAAIGQRVFFAAFEDGEPILHDGKEYVFVPVDKLRGVLKDA